jgi:hypothetical protein
MVNKPTGTCRTNQQHLYVRLKGGTLGVFTAQRLMLVGGGLTNRFAQQAPQKCCMQAGSTSHLDMRGT